MKKRVFVASSVEGLSIAYDVQENLDYDFDITVWPQGAFELTKSTLESLMIQLEYFDAAIFVFSPDDSVIKRGKKSETVRDNVIFELGLFLGYLGRERCFIFQPRDFDTDGLPTDLIGVTPALYNSERDDGNSKAALGPACNKVRKALSQDVKTPPSRIKKDTDIEDILLQGRFRLLFNPPRNGSKKLVFGKGGLIVEGNNRNEHKWRIRNDQLELINLEGNVFSRFVYDPKAKRFERTNDDDLLSLPNQYIVFDD